MFKNKDIIDNINIFGSNSMTPIIDNNFKLNPYARTLWNNEEENINTVNMLQKDENENIQHRLASRRKKQELKLFFKKDEFNKDLDLTSQSTLNSSEKRRFSLILEDFDLQEDRRIATKSLYLAMTKYDSSLKNYNKTNPQTSIFDKFVNTSFSRSNRPNLSLSKDVDYVSPKLDFLNSLEVFYTFEMDYIKKLGIIIDIYQVEFQKSAQHIIGNHYQKDEKNIVVLLFGNIQTMVELSNSFLKDFIQFLSEFFNINENDKTFWNVIKRNLFFSDLKQIKIVQFLENHFNKWKQCYRDYIVMHNRQLRYFNFLVTNPDTKDCMNTWLQNCETSLISCLSPEYSSLHFLNTLLTEPLQRVSYWKNYIESLIAFAPSVLSIEQYDSSLKFFKTLTEYNENLKPLFLSNHIFSSDVFGDFNSLSKLENTNKIISGSSVTSSVYSPYTENSNVEYKLSVNKKESFENAKKHSSNFIKKNMDYTNYIYQESKQLTVLICNFENFYLDLCSLKKSLVSINFLDYVHKLHYYTGKWKQVYSLEKTSNDNNNIYALYQQKLETQLIHISNLHNIKLQSLKKNIQQCLTYCNIISKIITERKKLINELKSINEGNIKFNAMVNQINHLENTLRISLCEFMKIASSFVKLLLLKFNDLYLMFLKLMAGNPNKLVRFMNSYKNEEIDFGDNFDIIQQFSINRSNTIEAVKYHITLLNLNDNGENALIGKSYFHSKTFRGLFN